MKRLASLSIVTLLSSCASFGGTITSISYDTAFSQGIAHLLPVAQLGAGSGAATSTNFAGVEFFADGVRTEVVEACQGGFGGPGLAGCPVSGPPGGYFLGRNTISDNFRVVKNLGLDNEVYNGFAIAQPLVAATSGNAGGLLNVGTGTANEARYVDSYAINTESLTVAATAANPAGTMGTMVLTYTINPPPVFGSSVDPSVVAWFGLFEFRSWIATGIAPGNGSQAGGVDLTTLTSPAILQFTVPFIFGTPIVVSTAQDMGMGWITNTSGPTSGSGSYPFYSTGITNISLFNSSSVPLSQWNLTDDVGNAFGRSGVIPEPSACLLVSIGMALLIWGKRLTLRSK